MLPAAVQSSFPEFSVYGGSSSRTASQGRRSWLCPSTPPVSSSWLSSSWPCLTTPTEGPTTGTSRSPSSTSPCHSYLTWAWARRACHSNSTWARRCHTSRSTARSFHSCPCTLARRCHARTGKVKLYQEVRRVSLENLAPKGPPAHRVLQECLAMECTGSQENQDNLVLRDTQELANRECQECQGVRGCQGSQGPAESPATRVNLDFPAFQDRKVKKGLVSRGSQA
ncbi:hypothetical protein AAFF_G00433100 [Aldrovandia affinis]|uniref:Uncharacterized protein n=1 Tax=Aldrovandia affinis TaxID=143900 RepID=A0AAD7WIE4_9TELE|nr:hypothetical protein AAFF_G00433100 [Aldrovandia affinis]